MSRSVLEKIAAALSIVIIASAGVFWAIQVIGVYEMLKLAYG